MSHPGPWAPFPTTDLKVKTILRVFSLELRFIYINPSISKRKANGVRLFNGVNKSSEGLQGETREQKGKLGTLWISHWFSLLGDNYDSIVYTNASSLSWQWHWLANWRKMLALSQHKVVSREACSCHNTWYKYLVQHLHLINPDIHRGFQDKVSTSTGFQKGHVR